jgi:hypothetical protein
MKKENIIYSIILLFILNACKDEDLQQPSVKGNSVAWNNEESFVLAEILAKSLEDADLRAFLKEEALKQFDEDHDVLIQMVKNKEVRQGETFLDILKKNATEEVDLEDLLAKRPLLTIFVPSLEKISPMEWNVAAQIPQVAVALDLINDERTIRVIDKNGNVTEFNVNKDPGISVIVLKDNERVATRAINSNETGRQKDKSNRIVLKTESLEFYLVNDTYEDSKSTNGRIGTVDSKVKRAWGNAINCSDCYHRDFIYYDISPKNGVLEGTFDNHFSEAITSIRFINAAALSEVSGNWTEGNLEFRITVLFIGANSNLDQITKVIFVNQSAFANNAIYNLPKPVTIAPWQMDLYGDRWKISVLEYDPNTIVTSQMSHSTEKGTNYKLEASGDLFKLIKIGAGFGGSTKNTFTGTTTIQTTYTSNFLGEGILSWFDPVIVVYGLPNNTHITNEVNTGSVGISFEPVRTW